MEFDMIMNIYLLVFGLILALKTILLLIFTKKKQLINLLLNLSILLLLTIFIIIVKDDVFVPFDVKSLGIILIVLVCYGYFFYQLYKFFKKAHE